VIENDGDYNTSLREGLEGPSSIFKEKAHETAYQLALKILSRKETTTRALMEKLIKHEIREDIIILVIEELTSKKFLDDERYSKLRIASLLRKGKSPYSICQIMYSKYKLSVNETLIKEIGIDLEISQEPIIQNLAEKAHQKYQKKFYGYKLKAKIVEYLLRRGCDMDEAWKHAQQLVPS